MTITLVDIWFSRAASSCSIISDCLFHSLADIHGPKAQAGGSSAFPASSEYLDRMSALSPVMKWNGTENSPSPSVYTSTTQASSRSEHMAKRE